MKKDTLKEKKLAVKRWIVEYKTGIVLGLVGSTMILWGYKKGRTDATDEIAEGLENLTRDGYLQMTLPGTGAIDTNDVRQLTDWNEKVSNVLEHLPKK